MIRLTRRDEYTGQVFAESDNASIRNRLCEYEESDERGEIMAVSSEERQLLSLWRLAGPQTHSLVFSKLRLFERCKKGDAKC